MTAVDVPAHLRVAVGVPEAAALLSLSEKSVRRLVEQGVIARVPYTDRLLIARRELARFAEQTMPDQPAAGGQLRAVS